MSMWRSTRRLLHVSDGRSYIAASLRKHVLFPVRMCTSSTTEDSAVKNEKPLHRLDLTFENAREAFRSKKTSELIRSLVVFRLCSVSFLVDRNKELLKWSRRLLGRRLFCSLMRGTFYGHFVAGADHDDIKPIIQRNQLFGVKSILDYSVEKDVTSEEATKAEMESCVSAIDDEAIETKGDVEVGRYRAHEKFGDRRQHVFEARTYIYEDETQCDENMKMFMHCIDAVSGATNKTGFAAIKLTALGRPQLLLQLSEVLTQMRLYFNKFATDDMDVVLRRIRKETLASGLRDLGIPISRDETHQWLSWIDASETGEIDLFEWSSLLEFRSNLPKLLAVPNLQTGKLEPMITALTEDEEQQLRNMFRRINTLVEHAIAKDARIMVDAEQTYFQPAISRLTIEIMRKFNKDKAVVFNTYQCYLKEAYNNLMVDMDLSKRENFYFGAKLVRGAYMEQERLRAETIGYEDPINPTFEATSEMYEKVLTEVFSQIKRREKGKIAVMVASHNEETVRMAVRGMDKYDIHPDDRLICFGQLLGMCDQVSFSLGQAGYSVYKYVPFGPVEEVLPYLSRRAMENRGILKKVKKERQLLWTEVKRRVRKGLLFYRPENHVPARNRTPLE